VRSSLACVIINTTHPLWSVREKAMVNEDVLDERLAVLEARRPWSPRVIAKLEGHIRSADDEALFRINPLTFAREKNLAEDEAIDLCLHATACGLFRMDWLLLCPKCSCVVESFGSLNGVHNRYRCQICQTEYEAVLDDFIAVTFTVRPELREITFHHPERLSAHDRFFKVGGTRDGRLPDGTPFVDVEMAVTRAVVDLPPGETTQIDVDVEEGTVLGITLEGRAAILYPVEGPPASQSQRFNITFGEKVRKHAARKVAPGAMTFVVQNITNERGTFCLAVLPPGMEVGHAPVQFVPFLTGKRLLTTQTFRNLFRSEVIRASEGIGVRDITLLFTDLKGSTALYDEIGDLNAFALVQQHFDQLQEVTVRHGGAVVKTIGDAVMATFAEPEAAVRAAIDMLREIDSFNRGPSGKELLLKIGIHRGASIAVTLNDRLDYFGQTVNIAARVQAMADANEIYLTRDIYERPGVTELLQASFCVEPQLANLRGIHEEMPVFQATLLRSGGGGSPQAKPANPGLPD
jgi:class 3 adenylate cyclase